ncbi:uncharacterized protein LOC129728219 [Wyeomyia smithii]|uniref:uncharacterized protein LOC129728219 n=1 Tax=Wyeomyia smithii TaxID=174621 RepID=UPI002467D666|nr:uncharacterized protein LOC129728219 [Wyeomyia smithii]
MSTVEAYNKVCAPILFLSKVIGVEIWNPEKTFSLASYVLMTNMVLYNTCSAYTVIKHAGDPLQMMKIIIIFGIASQLIFKFFTSVAKKKSFHALFEQAKTSIYCDFQNGTVEEKALIEKTTNFLSLGWKIMSALYFSSLFIFGVWPVYVYYSENELVPLFYYEIPYVDINQSTGYALTLLLHIDIYLMGVFGTILADYAFVFVAFQAMLFVDLLILNLKQLDSMLISTNREDDLVTKAERWRVCLKYHQLATEYLNNVEDCFGLICLIQVFGCVFTICDSMVILVLTDWYAAYGFLLVIFVELSIYFHLGNMVELKVDELYSSITSLSWNLLTLSQQNEFAFVMARQQRSLMLTIFGFAPMNYETYTSVLRALYQFFVIILQSLS